MAKAAISFSLSFAQPDDWITDSASFIPALSLVLFSLIMSATSTDIIAADNLHQLGYEQEMKRTRGLSHILFMTLAIMAVPFGLAAPFATGLIGGGPATLIWGWILVSFFALTIALSLAEICSKYPTSAGAYYWCFKIASVRNRLVLSWINGWLTMVGVWTICLSVTFGTAQLVVAGAGIYRPDWIATAWQTYLVFLGILSTSSMFCIFFDRYLPTLDIISACWTLMGVIIMLICLLMKAAAGRNTAAFALGHFDPSTSGWNPGWTFFIGLLPPAYTYSAIGMIASMAEEVHNPSHDVPRAIVYSIPLGMLTGIVFLLPIVFTLPDISILLAVTNGQPIAVMFELIMGSKGGGFGMAIFGVAFFCSISICAAASRASWAFARDKALPFSSLFATIHPRLDIPLYAFLLSTIIQLLLGLIFLGSSTAFNAFVGVAVMCLQTSYAIPVVVSLLNGRRDIADGAPFGLGSGWGWVVNIVAVVWTMFEMVLFSMPAVVPVTDATMNYASVVFVGFACISAVWYFINGRHVYKGPPICDSWPGKDERDATGQSENLDVEGNRVKINVIII